MQGKTSYIFIFENQNIFISITIYNLNIGSYSIRNDINISSNSELHHETIDIVAY